MFKHPDVQVELLLNQNAERVLCNHVILPGEFNPHNVRLWIVTGHGFIVGACWAESIQDALDELVDADMGNALLVDADALGNHYCGQAECEHAHLGNAGECADLELVNVREVELTGPRDWQILCAFAEARGALRDTLKA